MTITTDHELHLLREVHTLCTLRLNRLKLRRKYRPKGNLSQREMGQMRAYVDLRDSCEEVGQMASKRGA